MSKPADGACPHCGEQLTAEWQEFPPALQKKFGKPGEWYYHPCKPECERKDEQKEWLHMRRDARIKSLQERSGLSDRFRHCTFSNFDQYINPSTIKAFERAMVYVDRWYENQESGKGLYLCGGVGTGKTHLAVAVMNSLIQEKGIPSLFVTVPELLDNLRGAYNDPGRNLDEWMDTVRGAELLVLDDLGSEKPTLWVKERLFVIIDHRYRAVLPTIITSNIGPKDVSEQLGPRTASRIISMCEWVDIDGPDYRETTARSER